ncbi:DNA-processing protein DprA [Nocardia panacis]|uniref:DNA-processing protein DprA n=1 Tax=Nocardia panacis TaxID=2340916 RepID=A0A3A4KC63_9NOCA|nr:DNA-processing protein DprA [Nocardia panacis]RJO77698.1 DNA-processing protein DprA [Nocardia panacis]
MTTDSRRLAWAVLSRAACGPSRELHELVAKVGVEAAAESVLTGDTPIAPDPRVIRYTDARRDLEIIARAGGKFVTPDDPEWPFELFSIFDRLPRGLRSPTCVAPLGLWVRGSLSLRRASERAVAVIGSRAATEYGQRVAGDLAGDLADGGWTVVSGGAFGIDAAASRAALAAGGATIVVLAGGVDRGHPSQLSRLHDDVADTGLLISELPPGATVNRQRLLARNRLTVTLSRTVVAVEAGLRSGTGNTVGWANLLGLPACAVPGPVTSAASAGCNEMIRTSRAHMATCLADVLTAAGRQRGTWMSGGPHPQLGNSARN